MKQINQGQFLEMITYGAEVLSKQVERINALNVFPVPDGDTGTNMNMTMQSGAKSVNSKSFNSIDEMARALSKGMLMGARGNSGVILSQFFRGISEKLEVGDSLQAEDFQQALKNGKTRAYGSVMKAVEGTILTVISDLAAYTPEDSDNFVDYFGKLVKVGDDSLENTPNLLPVLKEVGVVDSGGAGLMEIFHGMNASLNGEKLEINTTGSFDDFQRTEEFPMNVDDITFGYCTEMLIKLDKDIDMNKDIISHLEQVGDSIVAIQDDDILKVHVHTEQPNEVFAFGREFGDYIHIKSENMRIQAEEAHGKADKKESGIVVVAPSKEMAQLFGEIQDVEVIVGGQTLNPSTEDIVKAIKSTNARNVLVFPNNSNIIMTAESAKSLVDDVNVEIVNTKQMTQALESLINFNPNLSIKENKDKMEELFSKIINIEITQAIKDTTLNGLDIKKGDYLIIVNGQLKANNPDLSQVFRDITNSFDMDSLELVNILCGEDGNEEEVDEFVKMLEEESQFLDIEVYETMQPVYNYLISGILE